jgi:hypothetical protein
MENRYNSCVGNKRSSCEPTSSTGERPVDCRLHGVHVIAVVLAGCKTWKTLLRDAGSGCSERMAAMRSANFCRNKEKLTGSGISVVEQRRVPAEDVYDGILYAWDVRRSTVGRVLRCRSRSDDGITRDMLSLPTWAVCFTSPPPLPPPRTTFDHIQRMSSQAHPSPVQQRGFAADNHFCARATLR